MLLGGMMHIRVVYYNDKYDYVTDLKFQELLGLKQVKRFYRPSEKRWVTVGIDRIRGMGGTYSGLDRRKTLMQQIACSK